MIEQDQKNLLELLTTVGLHDFVELDLDYFLEMAPIPTNRDSHRRVNKMTPIFDKAYLNNQINTLTEVAVGVVLEDFTDTESGYEFKEGQIYVIDGNTRQHYWRINPERAAQVKSITAKIHYLKNFEDVEYAYYPYNNTKSAENSSDLLQGLARRYKWQPSQPVLASGGYKTALDWASEKKLDDPNLFEAFNLYFEELKVLDTIPQNSVNTLTRPQIKALKSQAILASVLIALKTHGNNLKLFDFISRLSTMDMSMIHTAISRGELDPVEIVAAEYTGLSCHRGTNLQSTKPWLEGHAGSTKRASKKPQMDFVLYWIHSYITSPKLTFNFNKGIRPSFWENTWDEYFPEE